MEREREKERWAIKRALAPGICSFRFVNFTFLPLVALLKRLAGGTSTNTISLSLPLLIANELPSDFPCVSALARNSRTFAACTKRKRTHSFSLVKNQKKTRAYEGQRHDDSPRPLRAPCPLFRRSCRSLSLLDGRHRAEGGHGVREADFGGREGDAEVMGRRRRECVILFFFFRCSLSPPPPPVEEQKLSRQKA